MCENDEGDLLDDVSLSPRTRKILLGLDKQEKDTINWAINSARKATYHARKQGIDLPDVVSEYRRHIYGLKSVQDEVRTLAQRYDGPLAKHLASLYRACDKWEKVRHLGVTYYARTPRL